MKWVKKKSVAGAPNDNLSVKDKAARHEKGRAVYNFRCYFCHGYSGDAKTLATSFLTPRPRNFINTEIGDLTRESMLETVTNGRPGTAMRGSANVLSTEDIALVVDFIRQEFMVNKASNTHYHTLENGWPNHQQYAPAFPFALGEIAIDQPVDQLSPQQIIGRRIFMQSCITCHDRARVIDEGEIWEPRAVSYPRDHYSHRESERAAAPPDGVSGATPYARHEQAPILVNATKQERKGEQLFQDNCTFCHAADGTGKNWIGSFLEPHPRNLTDPDNMRGMTVARLRQVIRDGLPDTSMPAWKSVLDAEQIAAVIAYINRAFHPVADATQG